MPSLKQHMPKPPSKKHENPDLCWELPISLEVPALPHVSPSPQDTYLHCHCEMGDYKGSWENGSPL